MDDRPFAADIADASGAERRRAPVEDPRPEPPPAEDPGRRRRPPVEDPARDEPPRELPGVGDAPTKEPPRHRP
jgi:hypothetical protein